MDERKKIKEFRKNFKINENYSILVIGDSLASDVVNSLETQDIKAKRLNLNGPCFEKIIMKKSACGISLNELLEKSKKSKTVIISSDFANENSETGAIKLYN